MTVLRNRHIAKTISYRVLSTSIGFFTVWIVTGSGKLSVVFSTIELVWKPIQYYLHERIWYKWISYGITKNTKT